MILPEEMTQLQGETWDFFLVFGSYRHHILLKTLKYTKKEMKPLIIAFNRGITHDSM